MSTHKHIDLICIIASILSLLITAVFFNGDALGIQRAERVMGYEARLFDTQRVHTIDIVMDNWDSFLETCENEEYSPCAVVIDGEAYKNVGIRAKGNTSLSSVSAMDSDRYSFKLEFDQYDSTKSYYGLDKLSLNNIIQDNTFMKDYISYQLMGQLGVAAPLCSYTYVTVNGQDWGLYLAVEGVEDAFLQRNYGDNHGELYKPDSLSFGGGRGNGMGFNMEDFSGDNSPSSGGAPQPPSGLPGAPNPSEETAPSQAQSQESLNPPNSQGSIPPDETAAPPSPPVEEGIQSEDSLPPNRPAGMGGGPGGMGSNDVKLQYIDDDPDSYANIFENAKTNITAADQARLISSLKTLSQGENIESVVDVDQVIRYFAVHSFLVNGDSYTGSMIHNYYLYEQEGKLSMIPWDYNLAFGGFQSSSATSSVNDPIDSPVSGGALEDRPMVAWIFRSEEYTALYHQYYAQLLEAVDFALLMDQTAALISPYVEQDPTKFCTYEEFETGVATLREFCLLREESVQGQLNGTIPSTSEGQSSNSSTLIDASHITISHMGSMEAGMAGGGGKGPGGPARENPRFDQADRGAPLPDPSEIPPT